MKIKILSLLLLASSVLVAMEEKKSVESQPDNQSSWQSLPTEVTSHILSFAATADSVGPLLKELARLSLVNREFHSIMQDPQFIKRIATEYVRNHEQHAYQEFWDALKKDNVKLIEFLLKGGVNPNKPSSDPQLFKRSLPLAFAITQGTHTTKEQENAEVVRLLLTVVDPNAQDAQGNTALHQILEFIKTIHTTWSIVLPHMKANLLELCSSPRLSWKIHNNQGITAEKFATANNLFHVQDVGEILQACLNAHRNN